MLGMLLYHPFFAISQIDIHGTETITRSELEQTLYGAMDYRKFFLFPGKSFLFVNTDELSSILDQRFPLSTVTVTKQFPHSLHVSLEERLSTIFYDNGDAYHFIGLTGKVVEPLKKVTDAEWWTETKTVTSTNELGEEISEEKEVAKHHRPDVSGLKKDFGDYPLIVDTASEQKGTLEVNTEVLSEDYVTQILEWREVLQSQFDLTISYVDVTSPYHTIFYTNGPEIYMSLPTGESSAQIDRFRTAVKEISDLSATSYIDVRYPGKIYWQ